MTMPEDAPDNPSFDALCQRLSYIVEKSTIHGHRPPARSQRAQEEDPVFNSELPPERRRENAREIVASALRLLREACGDEVLRDAYGIAPSDRKSGLMALAARSHLSAHLFASVQKQDPFTLDAVAAEAEAVSRGDAPVLFEQMDSKNVPWRHLHARFLAIRWDAILSGADFTPAERESALLNAFGQSWGTIRKWRGMAESQWGQARVAKILERDRDFGKRGRRHWSLIREDEEWQDAIDRAGTKFKAVRDKR